MNDSVLNVVYSSDNNYAQHMGVSIWSLLSHNQDFERVNIFIIDNHITANNKSMLQQASVQFPNVKFEWISFADYEAKLKLNMAWHISISSYARLFIGEMLPTTIHKVIYLDCDTVICDSLRPLWQHDLSGMTIGAVQDTVGITAKEKLGIPKEDKYFNAGMLVIDLNAWRKKETEKKCIDLINSCNGTVYHHDQGVLNSVFEHDKCIVPMRYNTITVHYFFNMSQIRRYYREYAPFYPQEEINEAKHNPAILHFTPSFTSRPWVKGCQHPLRNKYWEALISTPWSGQKPQKNKTKWYVRLLEWRYRVLPF